MFLTYKLKKPKRSHSELTCVGHAALLALLPRLIDDTHPHQRCHHNTRNHSDDDDPYSNGARACRRGASVPALSHHQLAVGALCAQSVGHEAGVAPGVLQQGGADDKQLVSRREVVSVGGAQRLVVVQPGDARGRAAESFALQRHRLPDSNAAVLQVLSQVGRFCGKVG